MPYLNKVLLLSSPIFPIFPACDTASQLRLGLRYGSLLCSIRSTCNRITTVIQRGSTKLQNTIQQQSLEN
uniref:Uncharacterized protein n=1 Tax=Hyaloperonospora arabidopsidis (strain Emoy2) TaxID=559515 RepID=M4C2E5_HYAAE